MLAHELDTGDYDVVHVHEPNAPAISWFAAEQWNGPLVDDDSYLHGQQLHVPPGVDRPGARRLYNKAHVKIAVSEASRWTQERFYGGRYRIIPNGVDADSARTGPKPSPTTFACSSSAAPRSARDCRSRCAPSRRCAGPASTRG